MISENQLMRGNICIRQVDFARTPQHEWNLCSTYVRVGKVVTEKWPYIHHSSWNHPVLKLLTCISKA